jgi:hypothetical protein
MAKTQFEAKLHTNWAATRVFDYVADFRNLPDWHPAVSSARLTTLDPLMRNAHFTLRATMAGRRVSAEVVTLELDRPRLIVARAENPAARTEDRFTIEPAGERGVLVTYTSAMRLKAPLRVIGPLMVGGLRDAWEQGARGLARVLEGADLAVA